MKNIVEFLLNNTSSNLFCKDDKTEYTYLQAKQIAQKIACFFAQKNIRHEPIMLKAERDCNSLVTILGILLSNNYYVPVNPAYSQEKLDSIISSSKIKYFVSFDDNNCGDLIKFNYEEIVQTQINQQVLDNLIADFDENNDMYTIYTSGSTGKPKGVQKTQKNMIAFVNNFLQTFNFDCDLKIANQAPLFFDASMKDVYLALATGGSICFPDKSMFAMTTKLVEYLNQNQINFISWVPSALAIIARLNTFKYVMPQFLKYVFFVGEVFPSKYLNMWIDWLPNVKYVNLYGSTEIAGVCLYKVIDGVCPEDKAIPLGRPLKNNKVYLVDGEICVESDQIAIGYVNDEEKNLQVFTYNGDTKVLKTGDFAYINQDGDIVFSTRKDFQIKHMGYRIELQEIEISIMSLDYISSCAVLFDGDCDKIVAFISLNKNIQDDLKTIINDLKAKLPPYMVPNKIKIMQELPLNYNGKIDRTKLKQMIKE